MHISSEVPWSAPGKAPVFGGGCGVFGGNPYGCRREAVDLATGETIVTARCLELHIAQAQHCV